jgi:hypothetical protein
MRIARLVPAFALVALASALLPACGGDPRDQEPGVKDMLRSLARDTVKNDEEAIIGHVVGPAGQGANPVGAKEWETPEGRQKIQLGQKRMIRSMFKDAGIVQEADVDRFLRACKIGFADSKNCDVSFEIAGEGRRKAVKCTLRLTRTEQGWKIHDYYRDLVR